MIDNPETKSYFAINRKEISIWIDKNLANYFRLLNKKENKLFFEHTLKDFLYENDIIINNMLLPSYEELDHIDNYQQATLILSSTILRIKQTNIFIDEITEELQFIETEIRKYL